MEYLVIRKKSLVGKIIIFNIDMSLNYEKEHNRLYFI